MQFLFLASLKNFGMDSLCLSSIEKHPSWENEESLRVRGSSSEFRMLINVQLSLYKDSWYTLRQYEQKYYVWKGNRPSANHIGSIMWMQWKPKNGLQYLLQWRPFFVAAQKEAAKSATKLMLFFRHHPNSRKLKWDFHRIAKNLQLALVHLELLYYYITGLKPPWLFVCF